MRGRRLWFVCGLVAVLSAPVTPAIADPAARAPATQLHLALGDSVAAGVGASDPTDTGYVPVLYDTFRDELDCWPRLARRCRRLHLRNVAQGGATTVSLIAEQLPAAVRLLERRNGDRRPGNDVRVVTVTIGGNDVFGPVVDACATISVAPGCAATIAAQLQQVATNLPLLLTALVEAAGDDATVAVMTYYNPLRACDLAALAPLADVVLEGTQFGTETSLAGLNGIIEQSAAATGAVVVDTYGKLGFDDFVGGKDCLHPDDSGHRVIADLFAEAVLGR